MRLSRQLIEGHLDHWPVARLATRGADGNPQQVPIVFARAAGRLWSPVDGKPKSDRELARVRNLRAQPRASLLLDDYDADWHRLWWIALDVDGRVIRPANPDDEPTLAAALAALRSKYPQYEDVALLRENATLLEFRIMRTRSWSASPG